MHASILVVFFSRELVNQISINFSKPKLLYVLCACVYISVLYMYHITSCSLYLHVCIRESIDSLCRDGTNKPIVRVHTKAF